MHKLSMGQSRTHMLALSPITLLASLDRPECCGFVHLKQGRTHKLAAGK